MIIVLAILLVALVVASVILGYAIGRSKAEREFGEVILWLEEIGALKPLLEAEDENFRK